MVDPLPPCFAKKRLDVVENKGLALKNAEKRGLYRVENIEVVFAVKEQRTCELF